MITSTLSSVTYEGNGATTIFPFNFKILNSNYLVVEKTLTDKSIETLISSTDYTVSFNESNGIITLIAPLLVDEILLIRRVVPVLQLTDYQNQGAFFAETHENSFDMLTMQNQQQEDVINHSLRFPLNETVTKNQYTLPDSETRKGKYLTWNEAGDIEAQASPSNYYNETKVLRDESQTLRNDIATIYSDTEAIRDETETLKNQTSQLKDDTQVLKNDTAVIKTETQAIKDSITSVQMEDVNNAIASHRNETVETAHPDINTAINTIQTQIQNAVATGTIIAFSTSLAPTGFLNCDGSTVSRTTFANLFAIIGTTYGAGDGSTTFNVPNATDRALMSFGTTPIGTIQEDAFQGHFHNVSASSDYTAAIQNYLANATAVGQHILSEETVKEAKTDNINGIPRVSNETRPKNIRVNFCIKY